MGRGIFLLALSMAIQCNQGNCRKTGDTAYKMDVYGLEMVTMSQTDTPCDGFESINGVTKTTVNDTSKIQQVLEN